jgi:predicted Fe-S protein YdhL (DUF1289 family)
MTDKGEPSSGEVRDARRQRRAERRRRVRERLFDDSVPSPCISVCQLDDASDLCLGCRRSVDEIRDWPIMSPEEKRAALARIEERKARGLPAVTLPPPAEGA